MIDSTTNTLDRVAQQDYRLERLSIRACHSARDGTKLLENFTKRIGIWSAPSLGSSMRLV
ncbi:hypothetical protein D3C85_1394900 [compost metagenome]